MMDLSVQQPVFQPSTPVALRRPFAVFRRLRTLFLVAPGNKRRRARFTELLSGKTRATSGSRRTRLVPANARS